MIFVLAGFGTVSADSAQLTDESIRRAIDCLVSELYARNNADRFWEPAATVVGESPRQAGGHTALVVWALLHAGESYQSDRLSPAIEYLRQLDMEGTYAVSVRCCIWAMLPETFRPLLEKDSQWLLDSFSEHCGGWDYVQNPSSARLDNSIRQFGTLALWEASRRGIAVDRRIWKSIEQSLLACQLADGGWNYNGEGPATGSMSSAALASLYITQSRLHGQEFENLSKYKPGPEQAAIDRALAWLNARFTAERNPGKDTYYFYYLWGMERVGLASGWKRFGNLDWYQAGAEELLRRLFIVDSTGRMTLRADPDNTATLRSDNLAMTLMFLSRGRVPTAICKLMIEGQPTNNRPLDAANLAWAVEDRLEQRVNWQLVALNSPIDDWLEAPLVYLASDKPLMFMSPNGKPLDVAEYVRAARQFIAKRTAADDPISLTPPRRPDVPQAQLIKSYLDRGGLLLAVNEGSTQRFAESVEKLGLLIYPQLEWEDAAPNHWAFSLLEPVAARRPVLRRLSNGVRDLIILWKGPDLAKTLHIGADAELASLSSVINVVLYASEKGRLRPRLQDQPSPPPSHVAPARSARIVRAIHSGNWKPEPLALDAFSDWIKSSRNISLEVTDVPLRSVRVADGVPTLVTVSSVGALHLSQAEQDAVRAYLMQGRVVLFEDIGGMGDVHSACVALLASWSAQKLAPMLDSAVLTGNGLPSAMSMILCDYRPYSREVAGNRSATANLLGAPVENGLMIVSREDISHALLDQPRWGINGYATRSARNLLANIVEMVITKEGQLPASQPD